MKRFEELFAELQAKAAAGDPASGTVRELAKGTHAIGKKIVEEAGEVWIAAEYEGKERTIYHFDMYRIERMEEALDFGSEEYLSSGELCLVEWPEKIEPLLPDDTMIVRIEIVSDTARRFEIQ